MTRQPLSKIYKQWWKPLQLHAFVIFWHVVFVVSRSVSVVKICNLCLFDGNLLWFRGTIYISIHKQIEIYWFQDIRNISRSRFPKLKHVICCKNCFYTLIGILLFNTAICFFFSPSNKWVKLLGLYEKEFYFCIFPIFLYINSSYSSWKYYSTFT